MKTDLNPAGTLAPALAAQLANVLEDGERLVWAGQPMARSFRRSGYPLVPFGLLVIGFVLHWLPRASGAWFLVLGLLALIGAVLVAAPYLLHRMAGETIYAVTSTRALILEANRRVSLRAYRLADLSDWETRRDDDASGDLVLEKEFVTDHDGHTHMRQYGFFALADVRAIERILTGTRQGEDSAALLRRAWL